MSECKQCGRPWIGDLPSNPDKQSWEFKDFKEAYLGIMVALERGKTVSLWDYNSFENDLVYLLALSYSQGRKDGEAFIGKTKREWYMRGRQEAVEELIKAIGKHTETAGISYVKIILDQLKTK